jgi:hypothetical protein
MEHVLTPEVIQALVALLLALLSFATWKIGQYMKDKAHGERITNALWEVNELITAAVHEAEAVTVQAAKNGNLWDATKQQQVKQEVVDKVKANVTANTAKFIIKNFGDLTAYINGMVERQVAESKKLTAK